MAKTPETGQIPPDFTLPGLELAGGEIKKADYTLSQQRGKPVVLAFYPGDNTAVCTRQLCSYTSGLESFTSFDATVWAISPQGLASHELFARKYGLAFPLLADDGLTVARQYGITLGGAGLRRAVFVIDAAGVLRWKHVTLVGLTFPAAETISAQLAALPGSLTMRILIIGGTAFVGRHIAQAALDAGHEVTLFHRGQTGSDLFGQATHLTGDRNEDLSALAGASWDATIDMCAYFPRQVRSLAAALDGRGGRYVFISSVSAYSPSVPRGYDESAPLAEIGDPEAAEVTNENYGGLKVACEQTATELFGPDTTIIRPTYVIGPFDRSYRFTWWVDRLARGGQVLAPGAPDDPIQLIDAEDMARWTIGLLDKAVTGTFHAVSPAPPFGFGDMLATIAAEVAPPGTELVWVPNEFLIAAGLDGAVLPLWDEGESGEANMSTANPAAAFAAGLAPRPLRRTVADIVAEDRAPGTGRPGVGIAPDREAEVLARWAAAAR